MKNKDAKKYLKYCHMNAWKSAKSCMKIREFSQMLFVKMPSEQRNHSDSRQLIMCCCCGNKGKNNLVLTTECPQLALVLLYINDLYDITLQSNPTGLCSNCKVNLYKLKKGEQVSSKVHHNWIITQERIKFIPRYKGKDCF